MIKMIVNSDKLTNTNFQVDNQATKSSVELLGIQICDKLNFNLPLAKFVYLQQIN